MLEWAKRTFAKSREPEEAQPMYPLYLDGKLVGYFWKFDPDTAFTLLSEPALIGEHGYDIH